MKKLIAVLLMLLCLTAAAAAEPVYVHNPDGILSSGDVSALEQAMQSLCEEYDIDLMLSINNSVVRDAEFHFPEVYDELRGPGSHPDYGIFVVCLANRTYSFQAYGRLDDALYRYGGDRMQDEIVPYLSSGNYTGAFAQWLECIDNACVQRSPFTVAGQYLPFIVIIAVIIALIVVSVMKKQLLTAKFNASAGEYVKDGSLRLVGSGEHYLYQTVSVRRIQTNSGRSGGGGSGGSRSGRSGSF